VQIEPFKTRRAGKLSGGNEAKLALLLCPDSQPVGFVFWMTYHGFGGIQFCFPKGIPGDMLKPPWSTRNVTILVSDSLLWMRRHLWAELPWSKEEKSCHRYARSPLSSGYPKPLFAVKSSKNEWCCWRFNGSKNRPKVLCFWGVHHPQPFKEKFTGKSAIAFSEKPLEMP